MATLPLFKIRLVTTTGDEDVYIVNRLQEIGFSCGMILPQDRADIGEVECILYINSNTKHYYPFRVRKDPKSTLYKTLHINKARKIFGITN